MATKKDNRKVWLVVHPIGQYVEDVKAIARTKNVRIVDAAYAKDHPYPKENLATGMPELTVKEEFNNTAPRLNGGQKVEKAKADLSEVQEQIEAMLAETKETCQQMVASAQEQATEIIKQGMEKAASADKPAAKK